jgi:heme oxygenase
MRPGATAIARPAAVSLAETATTPHTQHLRALEILPAIRSAEPERLSARLRRETATLHHQAETQLNLPDAIQDLQDYAACLASFRRIYRPLETKLLLYDEWRPLNLLLEDRLHTPRLTLDLAALGRLPLDEADAPEEALPHLPTFAHALGSLYVLEGSKLGSQFILSHLDKVLGLQIFGASAFFTGHGSETGQYWQSFKESLDRYGSAHPDEVQSAIEGAAATFAAIGEWMGHGKSQ